MSLSIVDLKYEKLLELVGDEVATLLGVDLPTVTDLEKYFWENFEPGGVQEVSQIELDAEATARADADALLIPLTQRAAANGVATLDAGTKIPTAQLPALAINDSFPVASQAAMLALTAQRGDVAIRADLNKSFILSTDSPGTLVDWLELLTPTDTVLSVDGATGVVVLASDGAAGTATKRTLGTDPTQAAAGDHIHIGGTETITALAFHSGGILTHENSVAEGTIITVTAPADSIEVGDRLELTAFGDLMNYEAGGPTVNFDFRFYVQGIKIGEVATDQYRRVAMTNDTGQTSQRRYWMLKTNWVVFDLDEIWGCSEFYLSVAATVPVGANDMWKQPLTSASPGIGRQQITPAHGALDLSDATEFKLTVQMDRAHGNIEMRGIDATLKRLRV